MTKPREAVIQKAKQALEQSRSRLQKEFAGNTALLSEQGQGFGERVSLQIAQTESSHLAEVEDEQLAQIERAEERHKKGEAGVCEDCGSKIPTARLNALPFATRCVKCQAEHERNGGSPNGNGRIEWPEEED